MASKLYSLEPQTNSFAEVCLCLSLSYIIEQAHSIIIKTLKFAFKVFYETCRGTKAFTVISNYTFTYPETPLKDRLIKLLSRNDINLQLTLIYGANSDFYEKGRHNASEVVNRFPRNASLHCVEEADHHVQVQNPEEMQKYITRNAFSSNQNGSCYGNGHQHIHRHNSTI